MLFFGKKHHGMLKDNHSKMRPVTPTLNLSASTEKRTEPATAPISTGHTFPLVSRNVYPAGHDIDGSGTSDILLVQEQPDFQIGFWRNASTTWQSTNTVHSAPWQILGTYDVDGNGKADIVAAGKVNGTLIIGYYKAGIDADENWTTLGTLESGENSDWQFTFGKVFGSQKADAVVCFSPSMGKLGILGQTQEAWQEIPGGWNASWQLAGCGDFSATGKKTIVMKLLDSSEFYSVDLAGNLLKLGTLDAQWQLCAIGDFDGSGKDDMIFVNPQQGLLLKWQDGNGNAWQPLGQLDVSDWQILSVGRYSGRNSDELLVQQRSTGVLGYFVHGNLNLWREIGTVGAGWLVRS